MMHDFISLWLVPSNETLIPLQNIINTVTKSRQAQSFTPHVTLLSAEGPCALIFKLIDSIITKAQSSAMFYYPILGNLGKVFMGDGVCFHYTLGYNFAYSNVSTLPLSSISSTLTCEFKRHNITHQLQTDPHFSVLYHHQSPTLQERIFLEQERAIMPHQGSIVRLDRFMVIKGKGPITSQEDVASWEEIRSYPLLNFCSQSIMKTG